MDYIIVALWGLIAGVLFSGGSSKQPQQQEVEAKPSITNTIQVNEIIPIQDIQDVNEIIPIQNIQDVNEIIPTTELVSNDQPLKAQPTRANTIFNKKKMKKEEKPKKVKKMKVKKERQKGKPLEFSKDRKKSKETIKADRALGDENVMQRTNMTDESTIIVVDEKSIAVKDHLYDDPAIDSINSNLVKEVVESNNIEKGAITNNATEYQSVQKAKGLKLPRNLTIDQLLCGKDGNPIRHNLKRGESLTQIAQRYYADSRFWPYIFEVNRFQLSSPDKLQSGMRLYLPDPQYYKIDGNSAASIQRAKNLIAKYTK